MPAHQRILPASLDLALLRGSLEEIPFGVATTRSNQILYANGALERIFGADPGALEQKHLSILFDQDTFQRISNRLHENRVFDGRVRTRRLDGSAVDAEVHIEWYHSEALGLGGFLVVRDISLELGALARLLDQLGGALFRSRIEDGSLEYVSPAVAKLVGLDATTCIEHPVLLTNLVSAEERERLMFFYRGLVGGEMLTANAQVNLRRPDGRLKLLNLRATSRRDSSGTIRHIDGVVTEASREVQDDGYAAHFDAQPSSIRPQPSSRCPDLTSGLAPAMMSLSQELLREASQHLHTLGRELRIARDTLITSHPLPEDADDLPERLEVMARSFDAVSSINEHVRHSLTGGTSSAPLGDVIENVRGTLAPVIDDTLIAINTGDAASTLLDQRVDEVTMALTHLALRAFRLAGSGNLRIDARHVSPPSSDPRSRARMSAISESQDILIEIVGGAPPGSALESTSISSDSLLAISRQTNNDHILTAARTLIAGGGGSIEADEVTFEEARTVIRLRHSPIHASRRSSPSF